MSGTSVDGVDGALVEFPLDSSVAAGTALPRTLAFRSRPFPAPLRGQLQALQAPGHDELGRAALAANALADLYAGVVGDLLEAAGTAASDVSAIGAHGQTVRHRPELGYTIQLLSPARLAELTGIAVVADLRSADVAAGGQGAPLAPAFHATVFAHPRLRRAIVNLGGIANVSLLEASEVFDGRLDTTGSVPAAPVLGFDTGPANTLLDLWCERHTGQAFDLDGKWAAGGRVLDGLLESLLDEPYFRIAPPKSTGRDLFDARWLERKLAESGAGGAEPRDVQATLAELTAITVAEPCRQFAAREVWVCGGGARNAHLMGRLAALLPGVSLADTGRLGIDPQAVESMAFAWLAHRHLAGLPGNLPSVTGAGGPRLLGARWPAGGNPIRR
ncbi:anhydro-N-acetylmuramic acid kinase [Burkholderiaceae bacterium FT117]|uniref:anhydro-N-acetylmuramic acid kinase n=1 Tax=Zeimonas sediminis TaxID=2944268 RepID=UPI0023430968|nr:anhydro-N-acetylmuramic acid kinase [Zeimonas sediminis]MCM5572428.1 anhydro-N-acetylmuramic acid kinase [Zeimonas sediminis]